MTPKQQHEYDEAVRLGYTAFIDYIPVQHPNTKLIYDELKKKMPNLVVVGGDRQRGTYITNQLGNSERIYVYAGVEVAYADSPNDAIGAIGFDVQKYYVKSRLIQNNRYGHWSSEHNQKWSVNMKNIIREATKTLLPTQFSEVVKECSGPMLQAVRQVRETANSRMNSHLGNVNKVIKDELEHMIEVGYVPRNPQVATAMNYIIENKEEYLADVNYTPKVAFLWITKSNVQYTLGKEDGDKHTVSSTDELPEDIRGKLFVLMMTDKQKFIRDVGMKYDDNKFWVTL
jgi:hypothetical protein